MASDQHCFSINAIPSLLLLFWFCRSLSLQDAASSLASYIHFHFKETQSKSKIFLLLIFLRTPSEYSPPFFHHCLKYVQNSANNCFVGKRLKQSLLKFSREDQKIWVKNATHSFWLSPETENLNFLSHGWDKTFSYRKQAVWNSPGKENAQRKRRKMEFLACYLWS